MRSITVGGAVVVLLAVCGSATAQKLPAPEFPGGVRSAPARWMPQAKAVPRAPGQWMDGGSNAATATVITAPIFRDFGTTAGKGNDIALPLCANGGSDNAEDAWYKLVLPQGGTINAWTCSDQLTQYDTRLGVFNNSLAILACNDDDPGCAHLSRITNLSVGAGTYYIVVDGWNGASGPYELNVRWQPPGPPCNGSNATTATVIPSLPFSNTADLTNDCDDYLVTCELGGNQGGPDHWYKVTVATPVYMDVSTVCNPARINTRIAILDLDQNQLYCNDNAPSCASGQSAIDDALLSAGTYYIVVDAASLPGGTFDVQVSAAPAPPEAIQDLVPDILVRMNELYDYDIVTNIVPGHTHLRFSNATANIGLGKLYLLGVLPDNGDGTQDVRQRIWRTDGTHFDRYAGAFVYHREHQHIHFEDWAIYRLRTVTAGGGVGNVVVEGAKTSFCILDGLVHDSTLPGFTSSPEFVTCGATVQGLTVGWADVYHKNLEGQNLDITNVPPGQYWLESEADPLDHILEKDETNNIARIPITIGSTGSINPDAYEPNNQISDVTSRPPGGPNSPNLGPCGPTRIVSGLTVHSSGDDDYFRFYMPTTGGPDDEVRMDYPPALGNLELALLDSTGALIRTGETGQSFKLAGLWGSPPGWYYIHVYGIGGATSPGYALTIDPSQNGSPSITVLNPPAGNARVPEIGTYTATWSSSDPEGNQTWVDLFLNKSPALDGHEIFLPSSQATPGSQGFFVINPAGIPGDTYYVYARITDGGTVTGDWSTGTITIVPVTGVPKGSPPLAWRLLPAAPNPFNPRTFIGIQVATDSRVSWRIHDARGHLVRTIMDGTLPAGNYTRTWDGRDDQGHDVASGTYYMVVEGKGYKGRQKLTLLR
ncbi:MAG TPA: lysyl oxidase family protein [Tepidiformaceae bacterium]|nr:lysyl oxidase family protein [Tepidiformaceae bacterium]